jgi:hypothetical protein
LGIIRVLLEYYSSLKITGRSTLAPYKPNKFYKMKTLNFLISQGVTARQIRRGTIPKRYRKNKAMMKDVLWVNIILMTLQQGDLSHVPIVVIKFPEDHPGIIMKAQSIHDAMGTSTWMSGITDIADILSDYQDDITEYTALEGKAQLRLPGAVGARDTFSTTFVSETSEALRLIVQGVVKTNKTHAVEIARSCDMDIKAPGGKSASEWNVTHGETSGSVEIAGSIKGYKTNRYSFQWQMTRDLSDEESWFTKANFIDPTLQMTTQVKGLKLKETVWFRFRIILKDGPTEWSEPIGIDII